MAKKAADDLIPTPTTLLPRLKDWRDQASWQEFFDTYREFIYGVAIKAGLNEAEAKDVVQETMITVSKKMPDFKYDRASGSFQKWLLNTTRWRITDQLRKRCRTVALESTDDTDVDNDIDNGLPGKILDSSDESLGVLLEIEWRTSLLNAAIKKVKRRLDPQKYQIFDFCVNKEWPPGKVAESFGIPISQVYLAKHRVTEMIADEVKKLEMKTS